MSRRTNGQHPADHDTAEDLELVAGLHAGGAVGERMTGLEFGGGVGLVDVKWLEKLLRQIRADTTEPRADAIWLEEAKSLGGGLGATVESVLAFGGGPAVGRYWEITSISVLGADDRTTIAGSAVTFCIGDPHNSTLADVRLPGCAGGTLVSVPASAQFGSHQMICSHPHKPYVKVFGIAADQGLTVTLQGWDRPVWADADRTLAGPLGIESRTSSSHTPEPRFEAPAAGSDAGPRGGRWSGGPVAGQRHR